MRSVLASANAPGLQAVDLMLWGPSWMLEFTLQRVFPRAGAARAAIEGGVCWSSRFSVSFPAGRNTLKRELQRVRSHGICAKHIKSTARLPGGWLRLLLHTSALHRRGFEVSAFVAANVKLPGQAGGITFTSPILLALRKLTIETRTLAIADCYSVHAETPERDWHTSCPGFSPEFWNRPIICERS
jgi:hypothetical protein